MFLVSKLWTKEAIYTFTCVKGNKKVIILKEKKKDKQKEGSLMVKRSPVKRVIVGSSPIPPVVKIGL